MATGSLDRAAAASRTARELADASGSQRNLGVALDGLSDLQVAQGDFSGVLNAYTAGRAIAEKLAVADPGNADLQRDLIMLRVGLSEVATGTPEARAHLTAALEIARALEAAGRLAPVDAWMPTELELLLGALDP